LFDGQVLLCESLNCLRGGRQGRFKSFLIFLLGSLNSLESIVGHFDGSSMVGWELILKHQIWIVIWTIQKSILEQCWIGIAFQVLEILWHKELPCKDLI